MVALNRFRRKILTLLFVLLPLASWASGDHGYSTQKSHVHGQAELTLAMEGNLLELNLESPAANIVGFEHRASTAKQKRTVENAKAVLESVQKLFTFTGTRCELKKVKVDVSAVMDRATDGHDHKTSDHHHNHQDDHKAHSEISAHYYFACTKGSQLNTVSVRLFEHFPGIEKLKAMWITNVEQGAAELTAKSNVINLK